MTGSELKQLREDLGQAIGKSLSVADMAKLCGLAADSGPDTIRRWEVTGPSGPAGKLLRILAMASDRHPILENFNIFDRWDVDEKERPARRAAFREKMRDEIRERVRSVTGMNCVIELIPPRTLPRTSSGKLSRAKARNLYLAGEIKPYAIAA